MAVNESLCRTRLGHQPQLADIDGVKAVIATQQKLFQVRRLSSNLGAFLVLPDMPLPLIGRVLATPTGKLQGFGQLPRDAGERGHGAYALP